MVWCVRPILRLAAVLQPPLTVPRISHCSYTLRIPHTHTGLTAAGVGVASSGAAGWVVVVHTVSPRRVTRSQRARDILARVSRRAIRIETVCGGHDPRRDVGPARHPSKRLWAMGARFVYAERSESLRQQRTCRRPCGEGERFDVRATPVARSRGLPGLPTAGERCKRLEGTGRG